MKTKKEAAQELKMIRARESQVSRLKEAKIRESDAKAQVWEDIHEWLVAFTKRMNKGGKL